MTEKVKPEILMVRREPFPRCVIIDGIAHDVPKVWTGGGWANDLRKAMLFADEDSLLEQIMAIHRRG